MRRVSPLLPWPRNVAALPSVTNAQVNPRPIAPGTGVFLCLLRVGARPCPCPVPSLSGADGQPDGQHRHLEHQFGPPADRPGRTLPHRTGARRAVPTGDQVPRGAVPARGVRSARLPLPRGPRAEGLSRRRHRQPHPAQGIRPPRLAGQRRGAPRRGRAARAQDRGGPRAGARERLYPRRRRHSRPRAQPEVRPEARFPRADGALGRCARPADPHRWRLQRRPARLRRLRSQGADQSGQPHPDRVRSARPLPRRARLGRSRPQAHPRARAQLFVVELPLVLAREGSGPAARSCVGVSRRCRAIAWPPLRRGNAALGAAVGPCAAGDGVRALSEESAPSISGRRAAQAVDALRHGWPIAVGRAPLLLPVETAPGEALADLALISAARAATLKLANQREAADPHSAVLIRAAEPLGLDQARTIADPAHDLGAPLKGPFLAEPLAWAEDAAAALELARIAGILPAFLVSPAPAREAVAVERGDVAALLDPARLAIATRARLPVSAAEDAEIAVFRSPDDLREHVALVIGQQNAERVPLVRLHSECLTGDVLGSLKCDCGPQLDAALEAIAGEARAGGWGALLYLRQEGRGIGLVNKLRAYRLQDQGFDTLEANRRLGFPSEARDFVIAGRMLDLLGVRQVRLLTNNPDKVAALEAAGVTVAERVPHALPANPHSARYLATKRDAAGHFL
ncbi:MAG: GTP cyclohydrolase II [Sphingomonadales bacterium 12-68-11]|nr:MAG: GTP cyclohydrolase II [Sphingomonadales bacterium 12-68-11]